MPVTARSAVVCLPVDRAAPLPETDHVRREYCRHRTARARTSSSHRVCLNSIAEIETCIASTRLVQTIGCGLTIFYRQRRDAFSLIACGFQRSDMVFFCARHETFAGGNDQMQQAGIGSIHFVGMDQLSSRLQPKLAPGRWLRRKSTLVVAHQPCPLKRWING